MNDSINVDPTQLDSWELLLLRTAHELSISKAQYDQISERYSTLQGILSVADSPLLRDAHILVQGSIRLKTTITPVADAPAEMSTIDADAVVWLPHAGNADASAVLRAIQDRFRQGVRVDAPIEPLRRGIRIVYADENPGFHIDVTPARNVPGSDLVNGDGNLLVPDRHSGWKASSPIPYATWLEDAATMKVELLKMAALAERHVVFAEVSQDPIPDYEDYIDGNPLRAAIKLLKRHRDKWAIRTGEIDHRPISAVITTLAARAYSEIAAESLQRPYRPVDAIIQIVARMPRFVERRETEFRIDNPRDSGENFAEKWNRPDGEGAAYCNAFRQWHSAALEDIQLGLRDHGGITEFAEAMTKRFGVAKAFVETVVRDIPGNWTLPGVASGTTANCVRLGALVGGSVASGRTQAEIRPVDRLG